MSILGSELDTNWVAAESGSETGPFQVVISSHGVGEGNYEFRSSISGKPGTRMYINSPNPDFYESGVPGLADNFDDLIPAIRERSGGRDIIVLGSDTGGHAATRLGARLGAKYVIAFNPIISLSAPLSPGIKVDATHAAPDESLDLLPLIQGATGTQFIFVGAEWDVFHMNMFMQANQLENVHTYGLTHVDTGILGAMVKSGGFSPFYDAIIKNQYHDYKILSEGSLLSKPEVIQTLYKAKIAAAANDWDVAAPLFRSVIILDPSCEAAIEQLAVHAVTKGDKEDAIKKYELCLGLNPERAVYQQKLQRLKPTLVEGHDGAQLSEGDLRNLADSMMASKDYNKAANAYEKAFLVNTDATGSGLGWAKATFLSGDTSRALRILKDMHKADPENAIIAHNYGAFSLKAGKTRQALKFLGMAHDKDPKNPGFAHQYAIALMRSRKAKDALKPARLAAQERPDNAGFHVTVAEIADAIGDKAAANAAIEEALNLNGEHAPYHALAARILEKSPETLDQAVKHMRNALTLQYGNEVYKNELVRLVEKQRGRG
jgi:predicted Zn-dependent protease